MTERIPAIVAQQVGLTRDGATILTELSVELYPGEVLGFVGPSGSGKSSLLALLAGLGHPDAGTVHYRGQPLGGVPAEFGVVPQGYGLVGLLTAAENVEIALQARGLARREVRARAAAALAELGLADVVDHLVEELSGGQQQRVAVARALVTDPQVLIADEITAELDTATKAVVIAVVVARARAGMAVALATHDPDLAQRCDRVLHLDGGRSVD